MEWTLQKTKLIELHSPSTIEDIVSAIPRDCSCSRINERISIDEVLCEGCSSLLREEGKRCEVLDLKLKKYVDILTSPTRDFIFSIEESFPKMYRMRNPLLQFAVISTLIEEITEMDSTFDYIYECNGTTFLKEKEFIPLINFLEINNNSQKINPKKIITDVIKSLISLSECQFFHSEPSIENIVATFSEEGDVSFAIRPTVKSCLTFNDCRCVYSTSHINIFDTNSIPSVEEMVLVVPKGCETYYSDRCVPKLKSVTIPGVKINDNLLFAQRELGYPLYASIYTIYSFIMGLYTIPLIREYFENKRNLKKVWEGMWGSDELKIVERELKLLEVECKHSHNNIFEILKTKKMRIDISDYLKSRLL